MCLSTLLITVIAHMLVILYALDVPQSHFDVHAGALGIRTHIMTALSTLAWI